MDASRAESSRFRRFLPWLAMAAALLIVAWVRIRLAPLPLERDEGEFALAGQAILGGDLPYRTVYNMKLPGVYYAYAAIMGVFGQTPTGIHLGTALVSLASSGFLAALVRRFRGAWTAAFAGAAFAILALSPGVYGVIAHATHFVLLPALVGFWLLAREGGQVRRRTLVAAGVLFGIAFLMKQPGMFLGLGGAASLVHARWRPDSGRLRRLAQDLGLLGAGAVLPCLLVGLLMAWGGLFHRFWFWTVTYAFYYGTFVTLKQGLGELGNNGVRVLGPALLLWLAAAAGLVWALRGRRVPLLALALGGALAVVPGLFFRQHYFITALPGVACLAALALEGLHGLLVRRLGSGWALGLTAAAGLAALAQPLVSDAGLLFRDPVPQVSKELYGAVVPFLESPQIADYIARHSAPGAKVAVIGSEPQILFYAKRTPATGYIYTYALMEPQPFALAMQKELMAEVEAADPEFLVFVNVPSSWLVRRASRLDLFGWFNRYTAARMQLAGVVGLSREAPGQFVWDPGEATVNLDSPYFVAVFRRR